MVETSVRQSLLMMCGMYRTSIRTVYLALHFIILISTCKHTYRFSLNSSSLRNNLIGCVSEACSDKWESDRWKSSRSTPCSLEQHRTQFCDDIWVESTTQMQWPRRKNELQKFVYSAHFANCHLLGSMIDEMRTSPENVAHTPPSPHFRHQAVSVVHCKHVEYKTTLCLRKSSLFPLAPQILQTLQITQDTG